MKSAFGRSDGNNLLGHPLVVACVALTALNDHIWKAAYPGFLTGKLSDFAGLFFFPILAAESGVRAFPRKGLRYETALVVSAALGAAFFACAKTWPCFRDAIVSTAASVGFSIRVVCDPTDLAALVCLPLSVVFAIRRSAHVA